MKGIYSTGWYSADQTIYTTWSDMEQVEGETLDHAEFITVKTKPGYSEKFVKNELQQYGVSESVSTMSDLLAKGMGRALQSFAIINMVFLGFQLPYRTERGTF